jgi:Secreted repeat of unknown function
VRPDGSHQVTYNGRPLYLFNNDAYIAPIPGAGTKGINGADAHTPWGMFNTIRRCLEDSGTPHVPEQPKAPADSLGRDCVTSSTGSPTPNGGLVIPLSLMRCLGHGLRQRGARILPGKSSHSWSAPEGGRGASFASASGSHPGRRSGARSGM